MLLPYHSHGRTSPRLPPARLEAFSDGVIAVIITIMVLELKVPHQNGLAGLRAVLPTLCRLRSLLCLCRRSTGSTTTTSSTAPNEADQLILYANLVFLFCLSLLPFFTSYLLEKKIDSFSVALYVVSMVVTGFSFLLLRLAIVWRLRHSGSLEHEDQAAIYKHWTSLALYLIAIPLAFYHSYWALGIIALVTLVWIYPTAHVHNPPPTDSLTSQ